MDIRELLSTLESIDDTDGEIELHDTFSFELNESEAIDTGVVGLTEDGIVVQGDDTLLEILKENGATISEVSTELRDPEDLYEKLKSLKQLMVQGDLDTETRMEIKRRYLELMKQAKERGFTDKVPGDHKTQHAHAASGLDDPYGDSELDPPYAGRGGKTFLEELSRIKELSGSPTFEQDDPLAAAAPPADPAADPLAAAAPPAAPAPAAADMTGVEPPKDAGPEVKVGDRVHLGFGKKGGAGFDGEVTKIEGETVFVRSDYSKDRIFKGPKSNITVKSTPPAMESKQIKGTPVVSLRDFGDEDDTKDKYGRTVPKKLKRNDPRVKFYVEPKVSSTDAEDSLSEMDSQGKTEGISPEAQQSFDNSDENWKKGYKDYMNGKKWQLPTALLDTPEGKKYLQGWEEAARAVERMKEQGKTESEINEAEYRGRKVPLGKPMQGDVKKKKVYVKKPNGNVVKVEFGDKKMRIKKSNPKRRKSFRARHNCDNPGPRWKARYWSCRAW